MLCVVQETDENNFLSDISEESSQSSLSQINPGPESSSVGVLGSHSIKTSGAFGIEC